MRHARPLVAILAGSTLAACAEGAPARLARVSGSDTVVVHSTQAFALPVLALDDAGDTLGRSRLSFAIDAPEVLRLGDDGTATCLRDGETGVRVSAGSLSDRLVVSCRAIERLDPIDLPTLWVGGKAEPLALRVRGKGGKPLERLAARVLSEDSTIATVDRSGLVHPRARGETTLRVQLGDCDGFRRATVVERTTATESILPFQEFVAPALQLAGEEMRHWRVPPGRYEIWLDAVPPGRDSLVLAAADANCARRVMQPGYHCVVYPDSIAAVVVRNPRPAGASPLGGTLHVRRVADDADNPVGSWGWRWRERDRATGSACLVFIG